MADVRVLVVEDEAIVARDLQMRLRDLGYLVPAIAHTGNDAVRLAEEVVPDLVLMDINLDGKVDGIEAAAIIRQQRDIPVVYLTAYTDKETVERAKRDLVDNPRLAADSPHPHDAG